MTEATRPSLVHPSRHEGFTLIEILLAVSIVGVILAALYSTFFLADRALLAAEERLTTLQEARLLLDTMTREIESACLNSRDYTVFKVDDRDFYGRQASQIEITSFAGPLPGLTRVRYTVEERAGTMVLRKRVWQAYSDPARSEIEDLLENVGSFTIEVRSNDQWLKTWDSGLTGALPPEVKVTLSLPAGPPRVSAESPSTTVFSETALTRIGAVRR